MISRIALDTNLLLLWIIGSIAPEQIGRHKRLKTYNNDDFKLLGRLLDSRQVVVTPNAMTELSNLARQGTFGRLADEISNAICMFAAIHDEIYVASNVAVVAPEFRWLGLADVIWLESAGKDIAILTVDAKLYDAALKRHLPATNFNNEREKAGTV